MPLALIVSLPLAAATGAQSPPAATVLTLVQAVESALKNYPSIRVSQEQVNAAAAEIQLARTAYLPRIDTLALVNRATRNNVFGMLLPQTVIPSMSGPVVGSNNLGTVWGSAVGALVSWEPFDFGLRQANVAAASAARKQSEAEVRRTQFEVAVATADAYLTLVAAQETVRAAQAGVDRAEVVLRTTNALVNSQLRPGADASRADAELAAARTQLIQADEAAGVAQATVAQFVGVDAERISVSARALLEPPPQRTVAPFDAAANPLALERSYFPRFYLQGAAYSRGTGAELDGRRLGGLNGLAPNFQDYAVGFSVNFPVMDFESLRAREAAQSADIRAEVARGQQIAIDLRAQWNRAVAALEGSRRIAANTPVQVMAARTATEQATARYQSGLGTIDQVAEAQRLLTQAEIDDALARLAVWRALLGIASAAGDIQPFVTEASR